MKKKILSALTTALVLGVVSPSFAAPIDDEVTELRTRLAQLERRIAERDARIERESARVSELERDMSYRDSRSSWADKFNLNGEMRFRFWSIDKIADRTRLEMRLLPTMKISDNIALKTRFTGSYENMNDDAGSSWAMNYAYFEGKFDKFNINAGKIPLATKVDSNPVSGSMLIDDYFSGVQLGTSSDNFDFNLNLGRTKVARSAIENILSLTLTNYFTEAEIEAFTKQLGTSTYVGGEAMYKSDDEKLNLGVGYHYFKTNGAKDNIIALGGGYQLTDDIAVYGAYAHNSDSGDKKNAYNIEGTYLGAKRNEKGSWGAFAAYRYVPIEVGFAPTYDSFKIANNKGFDFGGTWTPVENTLVKLSYFHGKNFADVNNRTFFARASLFF